MGAVVKLRDPVLERAEALVREITEEIVVFEATRDDLSEEALAYLEELYGRREVARARAYGDRRGW